MLKKLRIIPDDLQPLSINKIQTAKMGDPGRAEDKGPTTPRRMRNTL
jgi:hypothetical protein